VNRPSSPLNMLLSRHTRRREFIAITGGAAVVWPLATLAQQQVAVPVIGYLYAGSEVSRPLLAAFQKGLGESGYFENQNVAIEYRWANNVLDDLPKLAAELIRRRVAVIATPGSLQAALAAKAATTTIPIVFSTGVDPVQVGLVASLNRPGGNVTGVNYMQVELAAKQLGLLHELLPTAKRFTVVVNPNNPPIVRSAVVELEKAASSIGAQIEVLRVSSYAELDDALAKISQDRIQALLVTAGQFFGNRVDLAALAARRAIPAMYYDREFAEAGGLISYGSDLANQYYETGTYTGRVLKGENPADMPITQATKFELVINLKTAKSLGLEIPPTLLARADRVIE
jgi:putative tryptophan/tyrosine transport system substrate-binding protein